MIRALIPLLLAALLFLPGAAEAMGKHYGYVQSTSGRAVPLATVTVLVTSTGLPATIYSDNGVTTKANPFLSDADDGSYFFYAASGRYSIVFAKAGYDFDDVITADIAIFDPNDAPLASYTKATLPASASTGTIVRVTDDARGIWMFNGTRWFPTNNQVINLLEFNAVCDGATDDSGPLQAAIDALQEGWELKIPGKACKFNSRINVVALDTRLGITISGSGPHSKLVSGVTSGVAFYINDNTGVCARRAERIHLRNLTFVGGAGESTLVRVDFPFLTLFDNVHFRQSTGVGLYVGRPQHISLLNISTNENVGHGVHFSADACASTSGQGSVIFNASLKGSTAGSGVRFEGGSEHVISHSLIETNAVCGIDVRRARHHVLFNTFENNTNHLCVGDASANVEGVEIRGNTANLLSGNITIADHDDVVVEGNSFFGAIGAGTVTLGTPKSNKVSFWRNNKMNRENVNVTASNPAKWVVEGLSADSANTLTPVFTDQDATPSVQGAVTFQTANTVATSITAFDNCYSGKRFTVHVSDNFTTFVNGAALVLQGGADIAAANGDFFNFLCTTANAGTATAVARHIGTLDGGQYKTILKKQTLTVADSGGAGAATATLTPTRPYVEIDCQDADGCTITMGESTAVEGELVRIVNISANAATVSETANVSEMAGAAALGQYDSLTLVYEGTRWVELSRSNN